jgi:hypothetical protein
LLTMSRAKMIGQVTRPGMQDADQAERAADETRVMCLLLSDLCRGAKERIVYELLMAAREWAELVGW